MRLPLALSVAGHAIFVSLLVWLSARLPPLVSLPPTPPKAVTAIFEAPPAPKPAPEPPAPPQPQPPQPQPPQPAAAEPPPAPEPAPLPKSPPPRPVATKPPPPPPQVVAKPKPPPVVRHIEPKPKRPQPVRRGEVPQRIEHPVQPEEIEHLPPRYVAPPRYAPPQPRYAPPQTAALPPRAPIVSPAYRSALAEWFATHRRYPESARERGEEGTGMLRLQIDRSGQVRSQTLVRSTGYPDLDQAIEATVRGAVLPAFPAEMAANESEITVTIPFQFRLER